MVNNALNVNTDAVSGTFTNYAITTHGSDWYFAVCAVMVVSTFVFIGLSATKPRTHRLFHLLTASITMVASIAYFTMGANLGYVGITQEFTYNDYQTVREIFYVRYIDWFITTPLLLLDLLLTAGMPSTTIGVTILVDEIMIVTGLVGALISSSYKWAYWCFGTVALLYIFYMLGFEARKHSKHLGADIGRVFLLTGSWTSLLWLLYPIAWAFCEGSNYLTPDSEAVWYGVLDLMAKPVFGALLLWGHRNIDPARLGLHIRDYDDKDFVAGSRTKEGQTTTATNGTTTTAPASEAV